MITDSFDNRSEAIISPESFFGEKKNICDTAIVTFSREIDAAVLARYPHETIAELHPCNRIRPIHLLTLEDGRKVVFYLTEIGSTLAATDVIEVNWLTGAAHFILFGSAGALDREATQGKYVVPTAAYAFNTMLCGKYEKVKQVVGRINHIPDKAVDLKRFPKPTSITKSSTKARPKAKPKKK